MKRERLALALFALVVFAIGLALNTRHNRFPYHYHPDEPGKTEQIIDGRWNFNHPMLLLSTTKAVVEIFGIEKTEQPVVIAGRWVSAVFTSAAIALLALLAWCWRGWGAAGACAGALLLHHQLYELSHYMKEDPAMLLGIAATLLAAQLHAWKPTPKRALVLGAACALAISGKYLGAVALGIALPVLWKTTPAPRRAALVSFAAGLLAVFAIVNLPLLLQLARFSESFSREMGLVAGGQSTTRSVPHAEYWSIFLDNSTPAIWLLLAVCIASRLRGGWQHTLAGWITFAFPFAYVLALSCSPKTNDRYFLPATAALTFLAAIGVDDLARLLAGRFDRRAVAAIAGAALVLGQLPAWTASRPGWLGYDRAFRRDDNADLIEWLKTSVPPDAVIAKDNRIALPDPKRKKHAARLGVIPQRVIAARHAVDLGSLDEMRAQGISHVIVSENDYGKFFRPSLRPQKGGEEEFALRRARYQRLFEETPPPLWERERGTVIYLHPGIRVYQLAPSPPAG